MKKFLSDTTVRTLRTFAQGFLAVTTLDSVTALDFTTREALFIGLTAGGYAVLTAFARGPKLGDK